MWDPLVVNVEWRKALRTFSYDLDVPIENRHNTTTQGALLR